MLEQHEATQMQLRVERSFSLQSVHKLKVTGRSGSQDNEETTKGQMTQKIKRSTADQSRHFLHINTVK